MQQQKKYNWDRLYEEYQSSGMKKCDFAEMKNISVNMIYKNFNKIEKRNPQPKELSSIAEEPTSFVELQLQERLLPQKQSSLALEFKHFTVHVDENTNLSFLSKVIRTVVPLC